MMKRKKVKFIAGSIVLGIIALGVFWIAGMFGKSVQEAGVFEWNDGVVHDVSLALNLVDELHLTRWYQEISDNREEISDEDLRSFVHALHEKKVSVYLLIGSVEWGFEEDGESLCDHLSELLAYNKKMKEDKIDGVMLDIESYITEEWKADPEAYMDLYLGCMEEAYKTAKEYEVSVAVCIPRDYDDMGFYDELEDLIAHSCDEIAVMNYGCGDEIEQIASEYELAEKYEKELHCILEFQEVGKHGLTENETYQNKGLEAAGKVWDEMQKQYPNISIIRDYHSGDALRNYF